ncbi:unnamed protein product [Brassica rapa]|uniref:Uncharacterized protein n=1 Tax=Brassica campestris TaxID=3711 RepID=A0A8D9I1Z0_BRACM|nr:unnamed protein product [Brassica rapa]
MEMLFGEFGTFGDGLETRMVILVHKTRSQLSQRPSQTAGKMHTPLPHMYLLQRPNDMSKTSCDT